MGKYIGIDLGTTFSCMAYIDKEGNPVVIRNDEGKNITSSTVYYNENGNTVVGDAAKELSLDNPKNYVEHIKSYIGRGERGSNAVITSDGRSFEPEEVSAIILKKLKNDAEKILCDSIEGVVITVPESFNDLQRNATIKAGEIAGLNVIGIINEPTAAALAFSHNTTIESTQTVMVYDLGGGTFDVTIMEIGSNSINIIGTSGDRDMGGKNFDMLIVKDALKKAKAQGMNLEEDDEDYRELLIKAENCKKTLSSSSHASFIIKSTQGKFAYSISRVEFESMMEQLVLQTIYMAEDACEGAEIAFEQLDKIILVGGSTRIPMISSVLECETGIKPSNDVHPDEAVAIGAAYHVCSMLENMKKESFNQLEEDENGVINSTYQDLPELKKSYKFTDATSNSIGLACLNENDEIYNSIILPKNVAIPAKYTNIYQTVQPYQSEIELEITQGEDTDIDYVTIIGTSTINISPREYQVEIEVTISCDENSIIHVFVVDLDYNQYLGEIRIDRINNITEMQVENSKRLINTLDISGEC